jgi:hypothetical protein
MKGWGCALVLLVCASTAAVAAEVGSGGEADSLLGLGENTNCTVSLLLCVGKVRVSWSVTLCVLWVGWHLGPDRQDSPPPLPADFGQDMAAMFSGMLGGSDGSSPLDSLDGTADWSDLMSSLSGLLSTPGIATPSSLFTPSSSAAPSGGAATDAAATLASLFSGSTSLASLLGSGSRAAPILSLPKLPLSASGPFAALLQPGAAATRGAGAQQLLDAIRQADALFHTPVLDDLFGGGWNGWRCLLSSGTDVVSRSYRA